MIAADELRGPGAGGNREFLPRQAFGKYNVIARDRLHHFSCGFILKPNHSRRKFFNQKYLEPEGASN
ncbi:MAG TPA: hypothetical protein VGO59_05095 [Verrucomicrobiae bacterium]|jgi:hypothetical protein